MRETGSALETAQSGDRTEGEATGPGGAIGWVLTVDVGREKGTSMPAEWAKSGARLPFTIEVDVLPSPAADPDGEGRVKGARALEPRAPSIAITGFSGAVTIPVRGGGWAVQKRERGQSLSLYLDVPEGSTRGDVAGDVANVWGLAPGVASQGMDVDLPAGRLVFETEVYSDSELQQLNKEFLAVRSAAWQAAKAVKEMEQAKNPTPTWDERKQAWVAERKEEGFAAEARKRAEYAKAEADKRRADERRPKRKALARDAGRWPRIDGAAWVARKGKLLIKRPGPFGIGAQYAVLGTWSAEPKQPVETFWTMPDN
jgi:hypothetical protein